VADADALTREPDEAADIAAAETGARAPGGATRRIISGAAIDKLPRRT